MQVIDPTTVTSVNNAPVLPVAPLPTSAVSAASAAGRKSSGGQNARQQAGHSSPRFRAALDTATVAGFGRIAAAADTAAESATTSQGTRPSRTPPASQELNATDTPELYQAVRAYAAGASDSSSESTSAYDEPTAAPSPMSLRYAQTAATRYAQSFFSVGGTFAARGDTLELSA